jgi:hypothetical protein
VLEVRDPADVRSVVTEVPAMSATEVAEADGFDEAVQVANDTGVPGLRFYTRIKTAAVRFAW